MFGIRFMKAAPTSYVLHYKNGTVVRQGPGLSFFYYAPFSSIVSIPINTVDLPFVLTEVTHDYQSVTVQGQLSYRINEPLKLATLLDFSLTSAGGYVSEDPNKLGERLIHATQTIVRGLINKMSLQQALISSDQLVADIFSRLREAEILSLHGIEIMTMSLQSLRPTPEMARALEAQSREELQQQADSAIYMRRNAAVEQERKIKESELNTEIAVETKKRQIRETQMEADIAVEQQRSVLLEEQLGNDKKEADSRSYALDTIMAPLRDMDWRTLMAVSTGGIDAGHVIAMAFKELAENAERIGELNITPDLLHSLVTRDV